jgi:hypothetical protein
MIIFGSNGASVLIEQAPAQRCPVCERERSFSVWLQYEYDHLYYIFGMLRSRKYFLLCDVCSRGERLERREYERQLGRVPIPFMHRFGCLIFPLVVLGVVVVVTMLSRLFNL